MSGINWNINKKNYLKNIKRTYQIKSKSKLK